MLSLRKIPVLSLRLAGMVGGGKAGRGPSSAISLDGTLRSIEFVEKEYRPLGSPLPHMAICVRVVYPRSRAGFMSIAFDHGQQPRAEIVRLNSSSRASGMRQGPAPGLGTHSIVHSSSHYTA